MIEKPMHNQHVCPERSGPVSRHVIWTFVVLLVALGLVKTWLALSLELVPDEAYYWSWGRDPDFCYYDQPGMIAWIEYLFVLAPGFVSPLMARLPIIIMSLFCSFFLFLISRDLFRNTSNALWAVLFFNITPLFWGGSFLVLHDGPLIFFWTMTLWLLGRYRLTQRPVYLYLTALAATGAMYSKFTAVFLCFGLILYIVLSNEQHHLLRRKELYLCMGLVAVLYLPVIMWNIDHDWIAYKAVQKLGHRSHLSPSKRLEYFFSYHGALLLVLSPLFFVSLVMTYIRAIRSWLSSKEDTILFCLSFSLPVLLYFCLVSFKTRVQPNWSAMAFPVAFILMIELAARGQHSRPGTGRSLILDRYWRYAGLIALFISIVISLQAVYHLLPLPDEIARKDRTSQETVGWAQLGQTVANLRQHNETIMALRYQIAAELEFYVPGQPQIYCMNAFGRGNQYDFRNDYDALDGQDILVVSQKPLPDDLHMKFKHIDPPYQLEIKLKGITIKSFLIYRGIHFQAYSGPLLRGRKHI
ncbi:glycosyltransferase family 39 protein [bacterium]|nr:glycosyltransferase family 39 protein [bacterium]